MAKIGYDNDKYLQTQSEHIRQRLNQFGGSLTVFFLRFGKKVAASVQFNNQAGFCAAFVQNGYFDDYTS